MWKTSYSWKDLYKNKEKKNEKCVTAMWMAGNIICTSNKSKCILNMIHEHDKIALCRHKQVYRFGLWRIHCLVECNGNSVRIPFHMRFFPYWHLLKVTVRLSESGIYRFQYLRYNNYSHRIRSWMHKVWIETKRRENNNNNKTDAGILYAFPQNWWQ